MKIKRLCLITLAVISANSMAMELYKGRILNHKEWSTQGGDFKVLVTAPKNSQELIDNKVANKAIDSISIGSGLLPNITQVNKATNVQGMQKIFITNQSASEQLYTYFYSLCAFIDNTHQQCGYYHDTILLEPKGYYASQAQAELAVVYNKAGTYKTQMITTLHRETKDVLSLQDSANSVGIIQVL